jgi:hypothetical protein
LTEVESDFAFEKKICFRW